MPKVTYTNKKGLVQNRGSGFTIADGPLVWGAETITYVAGAGTNPDPNIPTTIMLNTVGSATCTLADGTHIGQTKYFYHGDDTGTNVILTVTTTNGAFNTITFTTVGQTAQLVWSGAVGWTCITRGSGATQATNSVGGLPVLAV